VEIRDGKFLVVLGPRHEIEKKVKEVAEALEIWHLLDRYPRQLSGGQQQSAAIAWALVKEPFSNLDAHVRVSAREFVKSLERMHHDDSGYA
jgi:ABC-type sugar transport system ATPase subunit